MSYYRLGFFEREHKFYNNKQLSGEMTRHYAGQVSFISFFLNVLFGGFSSFAHSRLFQSYKLIIKAKVSN